MINNKIKRSILMISAAALLIGCTPDGQIDGEKLGNAIDDVISVVGQIQSATDSLRSTSDPDATISAEGTTLSVDACDTSGTRLANAIVDVGYGDRVYLAYTNEYGQLVKVTADEIILQDDDTEPVNEDGRYCDEEAFVSGTEAADLDQGHVIADSLGGVSNAYNITPQNSTLNRYGDQAYMEKWIREAGGATNFVATITYASTDTQTPSHYHYEFIFKGDTEVSVYDFDNVDPESTSD